jgi:hypothetical protein
MTETLFQTEDDFRAWLSQHRLPKKDRFPPMSEPVLQPGLWEFRHEDGRTEQIRLREREDAWTGKMELYAVADFPDVHVDEMHQAGRFVRYLGP